MSLWPWDLLSPPAEIWSSLAQSNEVSDRRRVYRCSGGLLASGLAFKSLQDISEPKIKDKSVDMLCSLQDVDHLHAHK